MGALVHGVAVKFSNSGPVPTSEIASNIIAIVGTAPKGPLNQLTYINNSKDAAMFGAQVPGFTIPQAIDAIFKEAGGTPIVVINVFDPAAATTAVTSEVVTLVGGKGKTAFPYVGVVTVKDVTDATTYVKDTAYSLDDYGNIQSLNYTTIPANAVLHVTYAKPNFAAVTSAEIIGTVNGTTGARTGFKLLENSYNTLGVEPKILIAPGFSTTSAIVTEMLVWVKRLLAVAVIDAPTGTTVAAAKTGRTPAGVINFNISDLDVIPVFPEVKAYDPATDSTVTRPYSPVYAGVMARTDREQGFWKSPSNEQIRGILGLAVPVSGSAFNADTDSNDLNALGITTILNEGTSGFRVWGNRSSAHPAVTTPDNFISVRRTLLTVARSLQLNALQFVDKPVTLMIIDAIRQFGNNYVNQLIGRGALLDGSEVLFDSVNSNIPLGKLEYIVRAAPPVPGELITFNVSLDTNLYNNLTA